MPIGRNIRKYRTLANLTQKQLADMIGVNRTAVTQWETGYSTPLVGNVKAMAKIFNVDVADLMSDEIAEIRDTSIAYYMNKLNAEGQEKVLQYLKDISEMPKYCK